MNELDATTVSERRPPKAGSRPGSHSAAREQAILAAAAELVAEIGYERVTVDAIAARARASKATMYRKWPGKAELVADALRRQAEDRSAELPDTGSVRGDLLWIVRSIAQTFTGADGGPSLLSLVEAIRADTVLRHVVDGQIQERCRHDGALVCARASARAENVDASRGPAVIGLALAHLFMRTLLGGEPPGEAEQRDFVEQILLPLMNAPGLKRAESLKRTPASSSFFISLSKESSCLMPKSGLPLRVILERNRAGAFIAALLC